MRLEPIPQGLWLRLPRPDGPERCRRNWSRGQVRCVSAGGGFAAKDRDLCQATGLGLGGRPAHCPLAREPGPECEPLPLEIWEVVFALVSPGQLTTLRAVCRGWSARLDAPDAEELWEQAYRAEWRAATAGELSPSNTWRRCFLARWWAHGRWGVRQPTVCTLMGKKAGGGTVTCVALGECGMDSGEGTALSASSDGALFMWRFARAAGLGNTHTVAQQHHRQCQVGDIRCPQRVKQFYGHAGPVWCMWFDANRDVLVSGGYDATLKIWSLSNERCEATLRGHEGWVRSLQVLQAGRIAVSGSADGILKIWNLEERHLLGTKGPPGNDPKHAAECLAAIEEQGILLSGHSFLHHLLRWDLETMEYLESFHGHEDDIYAVHAEGHPSLLASGSKDKTVRVWDARAPAAARCVVTLRGHSGAVLDLKLRGNRIASASMDKTVRMWDLREPQAALATLEGHSEQVHCVDFRDRMVLSGSRDTALKVWSVV